MNGEQLHVSDRRRPSLAVERLARWWSSASQAERFALCRASIHGDPEAPPFRTLQVAIYLAEVEAGETEEG